MHSVVVRPAVLADVPALTVLARATYIDTFGHTMSADRLRAHLAARNSGSFFADALGNATILLAETGGRLLGYAKFGALDLPAPEADPAQDRELHRLFVVPDAKRQGLGSTLLRAALEHPALRSARDVYLDVWIRNAPAIAIYQKFGFEVIGSHSEFDGMEPDLIMVRRGR